MNQPINHQATSIMEACGIDKVFFEAKIKDWTEVVKTKQYVGSQVVESLEETFTPRELAMIVQKCISELSELYRLLEETE